MNDKDFFIKIDNLAMLDTPNPKYKSVLVVEFCKAIAELAQDEHVTELSKYYSTNRPRATVEAALQCGVKIRHIKKIYKQFFT